MRMVRYTDSRRRRRSALTTSRERDIYTEPLVQITRNFVCGPLPASPRNEKVVVTLQ